MSLVINNNMMAMNTARNLSANYGRLAQSVERLSTGMRINSAADDAAGLAIREGMRADIAAMRQGIRNAQDGISMLQTAEGALAVIDEKLIRMKELAEQAATGTYTQEQRMLIHSEFAAMASEIDRIASSTNFNGIKMLCGDASVSGNKGYWTATNSWMSEEGLWTNSSGWSEVNGYVSEKYNVVPDSIPAADKHVDWDSYAKALDEYLKNYTPDLQDLCFTGKIPVRGQWEDPIEFSLRAEEFIINNEIELLLGVDAPQRHDFVDAKAYAKDMINYLRDNEPSFSLTDPSMAGYVTADWETRASMLEAYLDASGLPWSSATLGYVTGTGSQIANYNTESELLTNGTITKGTGGDIIGGIKIHFGPNNRRAQDYYFVRIGDARTESLFRESGTNYHTGKADIAVSTQHAAQMALEKLTTAIIRKENLRANIGAIQNRLENTITNLSIQAENLQASESRISDIDMAWEMTEFVRNQVLTQAGVAMLGQANSLPQMAIRLLG